MNVKKWISALLLCAVTFSAGMTVAAPAFADNDTALVDGTTAPNLAAAAQAMAAATQQLNGQAGSSSSGSSNAVETPSVEVPEVTVPEVDVPVTSTPNVDQETIDEIVNGISDGTARAIIASAMQYLGVPYVWGGTTPEGFDCSGLVQYVFAENGISLPRTTYEQIDAVAEIPLVALKAGDLVFWGGSESPYHVGIYIGDGQYIHAPAPGQNVCIQSYDEYPFDTAGRVLA